MEPLKKVLRRVIPLSRIRKRLEYEMKWVRAHGSPFVHFYESGHFYSPLPDMADFDRQSDALFARGSGTIGGVDLAAPRQLVLLEQLGAFVAESNAQEF